jgi:nudix-type nucleoside diphosphatase (YffH/AdpP family)
MKYTVQSSQIIFHEFFKIERTHVMWEQFDGSMGKEVTRYAIRRGDSVGIIPVCESTGNILLIKQFRYPAAGSSCDGFLWEIPAGMIGKNEDPLTTAKRELLEEIGVETDNLMPLISFFLSPGALDERFHLFYATIPDCSQIDEIGGNKHEHENLKIKAFERSKLCEMIKSNEIADAKTIASILFYFFIT